VALEEHKRWNDRHGADHGEETPAAFVEEIFRSPSWIISPGRALDVATGKGRHAIFLAAKGFRVDAVDISAAALQEARKAARAKNQAVDFIEADLDHADLPSAVYDLVVNFNFLDRRLIPQLKNALKRGGRIIFETYLVDQREIGHPKNPAFLLGHNELVELFRDFRVLYYREGKVVEGGRESYKAGLFAEKT
jgi:tellurite methyltransferase